MPQTNLLRVLRPMVVFFLAGGLLALATWAQEPSVAGQQVAEKVVPEKTVTGKTVTEKTATEKTATEKTATEKTVTEKPTVERAGAIRKSFVEKVWWNQPKKIEEIGLNQEQRTKMDAALVAFLEERQGIAKQQQQALVAFGEALAQGNEKAARGHGDVYVERLSAPTDHQLDMMIEVVALMTPEQRKKLRSLYPRMFSRLWVHTANPRALMSGGRKREGGS